jgi:hypothetical protein
LFKTADGIVNAVSADLQGSSLIVRSFSSNPSFLANLPGVNVEDFPVTLNLQVDNGLGFNSLDDVISIIRHWVYQETGNYPNSDSIPYQQIPDTGTGLPGAPVATGQPGAPVGAGTPSGCIAGTGNDTSGSFSLSCWFSNLTTKGLTSVGFLGLLFALGIGLFIYMRPASAAGAGRRLLG